MVKNLKLINNMNNMKKEIKKVVKTTKKVTVKKTDIDSKIKKALEKVRPALQMDGGDAEFVSFNPKTGSLEIKLVGRCSHCPMSHITLKQGIEVEMKKAVKEIKRVVSI